jgi:hypothetical protein
LITEAVTLFHLGELQQCEGYSYTLFFSGSPSDKVTVTKIEGSRRLQSFADYSLLKTSLLATMESAVCTVALSWWEYTYFISSSVS